jgi:hypothetical protein
MDRDAHALLAGIETFLRGEAKKHARKARSHGRRVEADDLYQEGVLAALSVVPRYDPSRCTFWTFAATRVRGAMFDAIGGTLLASRRQIGREAAAGKAVPRVGGLSPAFGAVARPDPPAPPEKALKVRGILWYAKGLCINGCNRKRKATAQTCGHCTARQVARQRRVYHAQIAAGLCRRNACRSAPAPGRVLCPHHLRMASDAQKAYQAKANAPKPPGTCRHGLCPEPAAPGRTSCPRHLEMQRRRQAASKARRLPGAARGSDSNPGEVVVA